MGHSPAAARRRLGVRLRGLREGAGKLITDAAEHLECSTAKISRLENGKGIPYRRDIVALADLYAVGDPVVRDELLELAADGKRQDWFNDYRDVFQGDLIPDHLERYFGLERDASVIKAFESEVIYGPLQSEEYVNAAYSVFAPEKTEKERARLVRFRLERGEALLRKGSGPDVSVILNELAIVRGIGGPAVMRHQMESLIADLEGPLAAVDFRIVPLLTQERGAFGGPFCVLRYADPQDQAVVYLEGRNGATYLETDGDVKRYEELFSGLERYSLTRQDSMKRLAEQAVIWENTGRG